MSDEDFARANRAFELFTLAERERALAVFAGLRFPSMRDRFFEAVYQVIALRDEGREPAPVFTECCDVPIRRDQRFCPKCGYEARVIP